LLVIATTSTRHSSTGQADPKAIAEAHPDELERLGFAAGSMGPKVQAACALPYWQGRGDRFAGGHRSIVQGTAGTRVSTAKPGISYR
jgi:carbamate kinase